MRPSYESRDRSLATQFPDRLCCFAGAGRLHFGLEASRRRGQFVASSSVRHRRPRRGAPASGPTRRSPRAPTPLPQIEHVDRAHDGEPLLDNYFGMLGAGRRVHARRRRQADQLQPRRRRPTAACVPHGQHLPVDAAAEPDLERHHTRSTNDGANDGFVAQRQRAGGHGLLDRRRPALLLRARQHVPAVRPVVRLVLAQTYPNRRFLLAGTALGNINNDLRS